jgi:hypothetical protein
MTRIASEDPEQARKDAALRSLLDNYERAVLDKHELDHTPDRPDSPCYDEEQMDLENARAAAHNRWFKLRWRVFRSASAGEVEGLLLKPGQIQAMLEEARRDEINRAADWLLTQASRCFDRGSSHDHHEAQVLTRYSSMLRDMSPFPYRPRETGASFPIDKGQEP